MFLPSSAMSWGYHTIFPHTKTQDKTDSPHHPSNADNDGADNNNADKDAADNNTDNNAANDNAEDGADDNDNAAADDATATQMTDHDADNNAATLTTDDNASMPTMGNDADNGQ
jgi:hypothetical protein